MYDTLAVQGVMSYDLSFSGLNRELLRLDFTVKFGVERTLELRTDPITIIQDFSGLSTIENKLMKYIKFYGILSVVFAVLLSILIENRKTILNIISESMKK